MNVTVCIFTDYIYPKLLIHDAVIFHSFVKINDVRGGTDRTHNSRF